MSVERLSGHLRALFTVYGLANTHTLPITLMMLNEAFHAPAPLSCFACRMLMTWRDILLLNHKYRGLKQYKSLRFMNDYFGIFVFTSLFLITLQYGREINV